MVTLKAMIGLIKKLFQVFRKPITLKGELSFEEI